MIRPPPKFTLFPHTTLFRSAPSLRVTALDAAENLVPTFTGNVTVAFGGTSGEGSTLGGTTTVAARSEEHTSELQSQSNLVCRLLLEKIKKSTHLHLRVTSVY